MYTALPFVLLLPLLGFLLNTFVGWRLNRKAVSWIGCGAILAAFGTAVYLFTEMLALPPEARTIEISLWSWIAAGSFQADFALLLDPLSMVMILMVTGVAFLIHLYSVGYMAHEELYSRYFAYLNLFTFSMLTLILANNFLLMFMGWEGVGLCSYLLIGFWFEKDSASNAGKKAFIVNRIGDFGFLIGVMLIFATVGSVTYNEVFAAAEMGQIGLGVATAIALMLFVGACGKSAQIPLHVWLPDAMEGPTPVSALIHAATMVTAGVYMIARCHAIYLLSPTALSVVSGIAAVTLLMAATIGLAQNDIKRVLAYSTVSQLGYMFLGVGVGAFTAGIFHLVTHAFFKALLFMGAGSVIHAMSGEQDIRKMGGLRKKIPVTYWTFIVATIAIAGIPPFAGFFSKDEILWSAWSSSFGSPILWLFGFLGAALTAFYMFRLVFLTFHGEGRMDHETAHHIHESPKTMLIPLVVLAVLSASAGFLGVPKALGGGNSFEHFLAPVFEKTIPIPTALTHLALTEAQLKVPLGIEGFKMVRGEATGEEAHDSTEYVLMGCSVGIALLGIFGAWLFYLKKIAWATSMQQGLAGLHRVLLNKYYFDEIYSAVIVQPLIRSSEWLWRIVDTIFIDGFYNGTAWMVTNGAEQLRKVQTGYVQNYILSLIVGLVAIVGYFILR